MGNELCEVMFAVDEFNELDGKKFPIYQNNGQIFSQLVFFS